MGFSLQTRRFREVDLGREAPPTHKLIPDRNTTARSVRKVDRRKDLSLAGPTRSVTPGQYLASVYCPIRIQWLLFVAVRVKAPPHASPPPFRNRPFAPHLALEDTPVRGPLAKSIEISGIVMRGAR